MKVLLLVMGEQRIILDHLYDVIRLNSVACDVVRLSTAQQQNLAEVLRQIGYRSYDRVVVFSRLKRLRRQIDVLRSVPGLVFLEHDACQNYMASSKYRDAYLAFYKRLPWARVLVSGQTVARRFQEAGVDAIFVSKGYDENHIRETHDQRDVEAAFVGSIKGDAYVARREMLQHIGLGTDLLVTRTQSGPEYVELLNRIRIFVSADVGMGEYMVKNFEAMACGCVLLAWSQGEEEDAALGFVDGENVMLYRSAEEALEKLRQLQNDPALVERIARSGKAFAERRYTFARVGRDLAKAIELPMRPWPGLTLWQRICLRLRRGIKG